MTGGLFVTRTRLAHLLVLTLALAFVLPTLGPVAPDSASAQAGDDGFVPVTDAMLDDPAPGDWLSWRRTANGWGYSPLDQVNRDNVDSLRLVWTRPLRAGGQEGTPIAYDGTLYFPNPNDIMQAIDAVTGDLKWEYHREIPDDAPEVLGGARLVSVNRNIAIYGSTIIDTGNDGYVYAVDAVTGELAWDTEIFDHDTTPTRHTVGPMIAGGRVISGRSCRPRGGPETCAIVAHDAATGEELWRRRLIPAPGEPGDETWGGVPYEERLHVGSWMVPSYDAELDLVYVGKSVTSPAPKFMLGGVDNKHLYHNSTLALDGGTGEIRWYYQHLNDHWDLDHPFERMLVDTAVAPDPDAVAWINPRLQPGETRKVITGIPGKTGVVYTLDRETGEFLWATPTITQNVISDIDGATGEVTGNAEVTFTRMGQEVLSCPGWGGGKNWPAGAYSPLTNTMFVPMQNMCARVLSTETDPERLTLYQLAARFQLAPGKEDRGSVWAISAETGEATWLYEQPAGTQAVVATGGGLVFGGDANGRFRAFDQETGEVLWEINLGSPVLGFPITYAVDGRQYVAASTGDANNLFVFALPD
ncbi:MAG: PQQ-binding-like beta-propeller repeat protein [Vicinamibacterales bacterium]|jgi:alcohol dehydrogenase (cytochrome c)|nr:PQQ-binding-like beta-propeller repeat protein [Vicinamibacterales bacterium]